MLLLFLLQYMLFKEATDKQATMTAMATCNLSNQIQMRELLCMHMLFRIRSAHPRGLALVVTFANIHTELPMGTAHKTKHYIVYMSGCALCDAPHTFAHVQKKQDLHKYYVFSNKFALCRRERRARVAN